VPREVGAIAETHGHVGLLAGVGKAEPLAAGRSSSLLGHPRHGAVRELSLGEVIVGAATKVKQHNVKTVCCCDQ
jgi:hypothetical protein